MKAPRHSSQLVPVQIYPQVAVGIPVVVLVGLAAFFSAGSARAASTAVSTAASTAFSTVSICEGQTHEFCAEPDGRGQFTFSWTKDGSQIPGATDACHTATAGPGGTSSDYCVSITGPCGHPEIRCFTLASQRSPSSSPLDSATVCEGQTHTFCTTGSPFEYSWTKNGTVIDGATESCYTATAGPEGTVDTYCVTATGGCGSVTSCGTLTAGTSVTASDPQDATACEGRTHSFCTTAGGTGPFTYSWTRNGTLIVGAIDSCYTATAGAQGTVDTYCVTVSGACGQPATQCATLTSSSENTTSALGDATECEGQTHTFCTTASGTGPFTYSWTRNGSPIPGATDSCYTATAGTGGTVDTYCVTVTGTCGPPVERCATLTATSNVTATALEDTTACAREQVTFCTTAGGTGPFTYSWTRNGVAVSGATDSCYTFELAMGDTQVCVTVTGACGPPVERCATLTVEDCNIGHCLLTQGAYGNDGGQFNGMSRLSLIDQLLDGGMTVGKFGTRSLSFQDGVHDSQCIIDRLPATGSATTLPNFGDETLESDCQTSPTPILLTSGRWRNILLGQVVTLSLNVRLAAGVTSPNGCTTEEHELEDQVLCATMVSRASLPGPDGCRGTPDDEPDLDGPDGDPDTPDNLRTLTIPPSVLASLASLGLPQTVGGLLELGNRGLAGMSTGTAPLGDVNFAVDGINNLFDECRELMSCAGL